MDSNSSRGDNEGLQNDIALESENHPDIFSLPSITYNGNTYLDNSPLPQQTEVILS